MIRREDLRNDAHSFLGEEFLTWLWFQLETDGGEFDLGEHGNVAVSMDDLIMFTAGDDEMEQTYRKGAPSRSPEAAIALQNGRRLRRVKLILAQSTDQWSVTLDAESLNLMSVKLPEDDEDATGFLEKSHARMHNFLLVFDLVSGLYRTFLRERLCPEYLEDGAPRQANWVASRLKT